MKSHLVKSNPFPRKQCEHVLCPWFQKGEDCEDRCYKESIGYGAKCTRCEQSSGDSQKAGVTGETGHHDSHDSHDSVKTVYLGESSRSIVSRSRRQYEDYASNM